MSDPRVGLATTIHRAGVLRELSSVLQGSKPPPQKQRALERWENEGGQIPSVNPPTPSSAHHSHE